MEHCDVTRKTQPDFPEHRRLCEPSPCKWIFKYRQMENWMACQMNGNEIDWHMWCAKFWAPPTVTPPPTPESCTIMQSALASRLHVPVNWRAWLQLTEWSKSPKSTIAYGTRHLRWSRYLAANLTNNRNQAAFVYFWDF